MPVSFSVSNAVSVGWRNISILLPVLIIRGAAQMVVLERQRDRRNRLGERLLVQSGLENRLDTLVSERLQRLSPAAGGLEPHRTVHTF